MVANPRICEDRRSEPVPANTCLLAAVLLCLGRRKRPPPRPARWSAYRSASHCSSYTPGGLQPSSAGRPAIWRAARPRFDRGKVIALALRVELLVRTLGWVDRFSDPRYSNCQRAAQEQLVRRDLHPAVGARWRDCAGIATVPSRPVSGRSTRSRRAARFARQSARCGWLRLSGDVQVETPPIAQRLSLGGGIRKCLVSEVRRGENTGRRLTHDYVVRPSSGRSASIHRPLQADLPLSVPADAQQQRTGAAVLVPRRDNGEVLQPAATDVLCGPAPIAPKPGLR